MYTTDMYEGIFAETVTMPGANGDMINAYFARPLGAGPFPAMVLAHHMPGWDQWYRETTFKFAHQGYVTLTPNLMSPRLPQRPGPMRMNSLLGRI